MHSYYTEYRWFWGSLGIVLILVLMEDALVQDVWNRNRDSVEAVLILVLMEDALVLSNIIPHIYGDYGS